MYTVEEIEAADKLLNRIRELVKDVFDKCARDNVRPPNWDDERYVTLVTHIAHLELRILKLEKSQGDNPGEDNADMHNLLTNALSHVESGIDTADPYSQSHIIRSLHQRFVMVKYVLIRARNLFDRLSFENKPADDSNQP